MPAISPSAPPSLPLRPQAQGEDVRRLQLALGAAGFPVEPVDGKYGPATTDAVQRFQASRGLTVDGRVGPKTWDALASASVSPTPSPTTALSATLRTGATGPQVLALQQQLVRLGYAVKADGTFGAGTEAAVKAFQASRGLTADGAVGQRTWAALTDTATLPPSTGTTDTLRPGATGAAVVELQQLLARRGYAVTADGRFGAGTESAVRQLQASLGLTADGVVGRRTWEALRTGGVVLPPSSGAGTPPAYFAFASPTDGRRTFLGEGGALSAQERQLGLAAREIDAVVARHGRNVLIGFDQSELDKGSTPPLQTARALGVRLHAYTGGPSGETAGAWTDEEARAVIRQAAQQGITVRNPRDANDAGMRAWNSWGWRRHTYAQLERYKRSGVESAEVDNLANDPNIRESAAGLVAFYGEYGRRWQQGTLPRLLPKNLSLSQWNAVAAAVRSGSLPRGMFADFAIAERGTSQRDAGAAVARTLGITQLASNDTKNYAAFGRFGG